MQLGFTGQAGEGINNAQINLMCGISGIITPEGHDRKYIESRLRLALETLDHRGPDASGLYVDDKVGLAHNRLSILDLTDAGNQPMFSHSGRVVIVFNGEIYNFKEIRSKYKINTRTKSDTEVIVEAFELVGPRLFIELNGMFSFAIYDLAEKQLWLVRDRLGIKPLYIEQRANCVIFSSEIKGLSSISKNPERNLRISALAEWAYYGNALGPRTMLEGIDQLEPGNFLKIDLLTGQRCQQAYWSIDAALAKGSRDTSFFDPEVAAIRTREVIERSIERHLISDVPVGVFLSGGIDSSSIACVASKKLSEPLTTYSAAFDYNEDRSELNLAAQVAKHCGSKHYEIKIGGLESAEIVYKMVCSHDQPFSDAANIPLYLMSKAIGGTHKVILQGDAGDEMFAGYQRYLTLFKYGWLRSIAKNFRCFGKVTRGGAAVNRFARMISTLGASEDAKVMALLLSVEREGADPTRIFGAEMRHKVCLSDPFARYREFDKRLSGYSLLEKMLLTDKGVILPDIFFQKVDRATMAASVEVRVPFADNEILDHVISLPPSLLLLGGRQKGLLRKAMSDVLPPSILTSRKKGFGVPFGHWVAGPMRELLFDGVEGLARSHPGLLDRDYIESLWRDHKSGRANHGFMLWKLLNLAIWVKEYDVVV